MCLVLTIYLLFFKREKIPYVVGQIALMYFFRAITLPLTVLGSPEKSILFSIKNYTGNIYKYDQDLIFSGHTALPFIVFLSLKNEKIKWFFLVFSFVTAVSVLALHVHYTIDVALAFLVTYASYNLGKNFLDGFNKFIYFFKNYFFIIIHCYNMATIIQENYFFIATTNFFKNIISRFWVSPIVKL